jgi:hypothetical protein
MDHFKYIVFITLCVSGFSASHAGEDQVVPLSGHFTKMPQSVTPSPCAHNVVPTLDGYEVLNHEEFLDVPDPIISRATSAVEEFLVLKLAREEMIGPLTKTYCQIGVGRLVVDMTYPLEDDSVGHESIRSIYRWLADGEFVGWQISEHGRIYLCARGRDTVSGRCS